MVMWSGKTVKENEDLREKLGVLGRNLQRPSTIKASKHAEKRGKSISLKTDYVYYYGHLWSQFYMQFSNIPKASLNISSGYASRSWELEGEQEVSSLQL